MYPSAVITSTPSVSDQTLSCETSCTSPVLLSSRTAVLWSLLSAVFTVLAVALSFSFGAVVTVETVIAFATGSA